MGTERRLHRFVVGQRVGCWTLQQLVPAMFPRRVLARCDCGWTHFFALHHLYEGVGCQRCVSAGRKKAAPTSRTRAFRRFSPGEKWANWTVIEDTRKQAGERAVLCRCDCGTERQRDAITLRRQHAGGHCSECLRTRPATNALRKREEERAAARVKKAAEHAAAEQRRQERVHAAAAKVAARSAWVQRLRAQALDAAIQVADRRTQEPAAEAQRAAPALEPRSSHEHFIAGVGTDVRGDVCYFSCEVFVTHADAVEHLTSTCELTKLQQVQLRRGGFVRLSGPADGAAYVEITRCDCATPHVHSDSGSGVEAAE